MYLLNLIPKSSQNILTDQSIFWYPLKLTTRRQLISINISTIESFENIKKMWAGRRIAASYKLNNSNICFIYFGYRGSKIIADTLGERPLYEGKRALNYYFSDMEIEDIYKTIKLASGEEYDITTSDNEIIISCQHQFERYFEKEWDTKFTKIERTAQYSTNLIAPHPIMHLLDFIDGSLFTEIYYKQLFLFLLKNDLLMKWIHPIDIADNLRSSILEDSINISKNEIKNIYELDKSIQKIAVDIFNKCEIFNSLFLSVQFGNKKSIIKKLLNNLYSLLPDREKQIVEKASYYFQPKVLIKSIEIHFIIRYLSPSRLDNIYNDLKELFDNVEYYSSQKRDMIEIADQSHIGHKKYINSTINRHRFFCKFILYNPIDCSKLQIKVQELGDSINVILKENRIRESIEEMWVKAISIQALMPPSFEDDFQYAISHAWPVARETNKDFVDSVENIKSVHYIIYCDYPVYKREQYLFPLEYSKDIQYLYSILNNRLVQLHNFSQFSGNEDISTHMHP